MLVVFWPLVSDSEYVMFSRDGTVTAMSTGAMGLLRISHRELLDTQPRITDWCRRRAAPARAHACVC